MSKLIKFSEPVLKIEDIEENEVFMSGFDGIGEYDPDALWE